MTAAIADVEEALKDVVDPELGINVVDLGLVYGIHVDEENVLRTTADPWILVGHRGVDFRAASMEGFDDCMLTPPAADDQDLHDVDGGGSEGRDF